jgi:hypothetical protein
MEKLVNNNKRRRDFLLQRVLGLGLWNGLAFWTHVFLVAQDEDHGMWA